MGDRCRSQDSYEDTEEQDTDTMDNCFVNNNDDNNDNHNIDTSNGDNNGGKGRDSDINDIDGHVLQGPLLNPANIKVDHTLTLDIFDDQVNIDNAEQEHVGDPGIVEVSPAANLRPRQQVSIPRSKKRRPSETETNTSKKFRATDTREDPQKLDQGLIQKTRNGSASAFLETLASSLKGAESDVLFLCRCLLGILLSNHTFYFVVVCLVLSIERNGRKEVQA